MNQQPTRLIAKSVLFFSEHDEDAFFHWLEILACVAEYHGEGIDLLITLKDDSLDDESLRELLALFNRYDIDLSQLAKFETDANRHWFRDSKAYWYEKVFRGTALHEQ